MKQQKVFTIYASTDKNRKLYKKSGDGYINWLYISEDLIRGATYCDGICKYNGELC